MRFKILGGDFFMLFRKVFRFASKIGQEIRLWQGVSISDPQAHTGFNVLKTA